MMRREYGGLKGQLNRKEWKFGDFAEILRGKKWELLTICN